MSGIKGRSGRKPLSREEHILRGTYRPDRHGPLDESQEQAAQPATKLPAHVLSGLQRAGREAVRQLWADFGEWSNADLLLLPLVGQATDRRAEARAALKEHGIVLTTRTGRQYPNPWLRVEAQATRELMALFRQLGLESD